MKLLDSIPPRDLRKGWTVPAAAGANHCERIGEAAYREAHAATGSVYVIRNPATNALKIGHSGDPRRRLRELQTGNSVRLEIVGLVAASRKFEALMQEEFSDLALEGEWFSGADEILAWLNRLTGGEPVGACRFVSGRSSPGWWVWDEETQSHRFSEGATV